MPYDTETEMSGCSPILILIIIVAIFLAMKNSPRIEYAVDKETPYVVVQYRDGDYTYSVVGDSIR